MKNTIIEPPLVENRSDQRAAVAFAVQARKVLCQRYQDEFTLTTTASGAYEAIYTSETIPDDSAWEFDALILGRATAGGAARARYEFAGLVYRESGGAATLEGGAFTVLVAIESVAGFNAQLSVTGNTVSVDVRDDGVRTMDWRALVMVREV